MIRAFVGSPGDFSVFKDGLWPGAEAPLKALIYIEDQMVWGVAANSAKVDELLLANKDFLWNSSLLTRKGILPIINYFSYTEFFPICPWRKISGSCNSGVCHHWVLIEFLQR